MLIDSQATCDVFCNKSLLTNIRDASCTLNIHTNTGVGQTTLIGDLRGYGTVWYYPKGIANILSLAKVAERYRVTYDSLDGYFVVHKPNGKKVIFKKCAKGLHYKDVKLGQTQDGTALLTTVEQNKLQYHPRDVKQAELARQIQKIIGRPSTKDFIRYVEANLLPNCPVTRADILAAERIFGKDIGSIRGKTVRRRPKPVETTETIPPPIPERYQQVTLCADIMRINGVPLLVTISTKLKFSTSERLGSLDAKTLQTALNRVFKLYSHRSFKITEFRADGEFECLRYELPAGTTVNICGEDEHVPEIE